MVLSSADFFSKSVCLLLFFKKHLSGISVVQFGSRSCPVFCGPDLGPNCLKGYQQTTLHIVSKELMTSLWQIREFYNLFVFQKEQLSRKKIWQRTLTQHLDSDNTVT